MLLLLLQQLLLLPFVVAAAAAAAALADDAAAVGAAAVGASTVVAYSSITLAFLSFCTLQVQFSDKLPLTPGCCISCCCSQWPEARFMNLSWG